MVLPQPIQQSINLMGEQPVLALTLATCVFGATAFLGGYRPSFNVASIKKRLVGSKQALGADSDSGLIEKEIAPEESLAKDYPTPEQVSRWIDAIETKSFSVAIDTIKQYLIGQLRFYDLYQNDTPSIPVLRNIKSIQWDRKESEFKVVLHSSSNEVGQKIQKVLNDLIKDYAATVTWPNYPFEFIVNNSVSSNDENKAFIPEYAGYIAALAKESQGTTPLELELKIQSMRLDSNTLEVVWRSHERPTQIEQALLLSAWGDFGYPVSSEGELINLKQTVTKDDKPQQAAGSKNSKQVITGIESVLNAPETLVLSSKSNVGITLYKNQSRSTFIN